MDQNDLETFSKFSTFDLDRELFWIQNQLNFLEPTFENIRYLSRLETEKLTLLKVLSWRHTSCPLITLLSKFRSYQIISSSLIFLDSLKSQLKPTEKVKIISRNSANFVLWKKEK